LQAVDVLASVHVAVLAEQAAQVLPLTKYPLRQPAGVPPEHPLAGSVLAGHAEQTGGVALVA